MTNKYMFFIANWKMHGDQKSLNSLNKVIKFSRSRKNYKNKLIYCPPYTLLNHFVKKLKGTKIMVGAQNCNENENFGPFTGSINCRMIKNSGAQYVIIGHSENRIEGDNNYLINKKIKSAIKSNLNIIFCIGETLLEKRKKLTHRILKTQISQALKNIKLKKNILFSYEPVWSIGTGIIPKIDDLQININFIRNFLVNRYNIKKPKILYGGSVNEKNIKLLKKIKGNNGFLIGTASLNTKKFIDIVKKTFI